MAETPPPKRLREESLHEENSKRQKPYNNILSLLDEDEVEEEQLEPSQDLSAIFTTLQRELSTDSTTTFEFDSLPSTAEEEVGPPHNHHQDTTGSPNFTDLDEGLRSVMTHLLEASDDELGIPNVQGPDGNYSTADVRSDENFPFAYNDNGLWEFEDEAANYYTVLQSELFM